MPTRIAFFTIALASFMTLSGSAFGQSPNEGRSYSKFFNGSFYEFSVRGGLSAVAGEDLDAWSVDAGLRQALPMLLADTRISYRYDRLSPDDDSLRLEHHRLMVHGAIHPFYFFLLGSDWFAYVISSPYLELGVGGQYGLLDVADEPEDDLELILSIGAGLDIPLSDPDRGFAPWLNVLYRYSASGFDRPDGSELDTDQHSFIIGLGWRVNGLLF